LPNPIILFLLIFSNCSDPWQNIHEQGRIPVIEPDYTGVTIPVNIAPMNFIIKEKGKNYRIRAVSGDGEWVIDIKSSDGIVCFPLKSWKKLLNKSRGDKLKIEILVSDRSDSAKKFEPFFMRVAEEPVDPWLVYRLINPGYYSWSGIKIMQRCLENFKEEILLDNSVLDKNCINCHSFASNSPGRFLVHIRGSRSGTYIVDNGIITRTDPKIESMPGSATYPSWHPGGRYVVFSSNQVRQSFYAGAKKSIEVFDLASSLILYDTKGNDIMSINEDDTNNYFRTFPGWSNDGKYIYYCRAINHNRGNNPEMADILNTHYDLVRKPFNEETRSFGMTEIIFAAAGNDKSVSFPRVSQDGKYLVFTLHDFGTFPIWHAEADLYILNLKNGEVNKMDINSTEAESYHSWSVNSRWLVFSSKRSDGRSTRPYFAYIEQDGRSGKPFILPQKDPELYNSMLESFNIPEFVTGRIDAGPRDFEAAGRQEALRATDGDPADDSVPVKPAYNPDTATMSRPVHQ